MKVLRYIWAHKPLILLILVYALLSLSFIWGNGDYSCIDGVCGIRIGGWHLHDSMWHLALVKMGFTEYPFVHPEFAGATLSGYNYLLDLVIYGLTKIGLDSFFVFFKLLPLLFVPLYAYLLVSYGLSRNKSPLYIGSLLFFMFFGSSFTYLITLIYNHSFYYSSMKGFPVVTSIQPGLIFLNIQYAYSLVCLLGILLLLKRNHNLKRNLLIGLLVFLITGLKFYGGAIALLIIALYQLLQFFKSKKLSQLVTSLAPTLFFFILSVGLFYLSSSATPNSVFNFAPFALIHTMIEDKLLFYNENLTFARYYLYSKGVSPRLIAIELYSIFLFLLVNFGTRLFAFVTVLIKIVKKKLTSMDSIFLVVIIFSILVPIFFVQDGGWYNTMQFTYYGVFLASFFAADLLYLLLQKKKFWSITLATIIILLTLPNNLDQLRYIKKEPKEIITKSELDALDFLANQEKGTVFVNHGYKKTAYISVFSGQSTYFTDVDQLMLTHVDYKEREEQMLHPWSINPSTLPVRYWYLVKSDLEYDVHKKQMELRKKQYQLIYENDAVDIYEYTK